MKTIIFCIAMCLCCCYAYAEFDVEVGDVYYLKDGTPAIVTSVSEDRMEIITNSELYKAREEAQEGWRIGETELEVLKQILMELKQILMELRKR